MNKRKKILFAKQDKCLFPRGFALSELMIHGIRDLQRKLQKSIEKDNKKSNLLFMARETELEYDLFNNKEIEKICKCFDINKKELSQISLLAYINTIIDYWDLQKEMDEWDNLSNDALEFSEV